MDYKIFRVINQYTGCNNILDNIMSLISQKMRYIFLSILIINWVRKKFHKKLSLLIIISVGVNLLSEMIIKGLYFKPRPFVNHIVNILPPFPSHQSSSFPSRHTTLAFVVATSVMFYKRILGLVMYVLACCTGFSRIWMGHHYPFDVVSSAVIGSCTSLFTHLIINKMKL